MKIKKSTRVLAAFLALVMALSSLLALPFNSFAATTGDLEALITEYENKMKDTTKTYVNLENSYKAYYTAQATLVGYKAGMKTDADINAAYNALSAETAGNKMTVKTPPTGTGTAVWGNGASTIDKSNYSNLLWSKGTETDFSTNADLNARGSGLSWGSKYHCTGYVYYPETTLLYDGTVPSMPISIAFIKPGDSTATPKNFWAKTGNGMELRANWHGFTDMKNGVMWSDATDKDVSYVANGSPTNGQSMDNKSTKRIFSNTLYYTSVPTATLTTIASTTWNWAHDSANGDMTHSVAIRIINFKKLVDSVKGYSIDVKSGSYDSVLAYCKAIDAATTFDPNTYFTSSNDYTGCANKIDELIAAVNSAKTAYNNSTGSMDVSSYTSLALKYTQYKGLYDAGNPDGYYSDDSFAAFKAAFDASGAAELLAAVSNESQRMTKTTDEEINIDNAVALLQTKLNYVDDTELKALFSKYYALNRGRYTDASLQVLDDAVTEALRYYNNNKYSDGITLIKDNDADEATYARIYDAVNVAIASLERDPNSVVSASYEVTGSIKVDPVLYVHGEYNGDANSEYAYMMNGRGTKFISDGTAVGELSTSVTLPVGKELGGITVYDDSNNRVSDDSVYVQDGKIKGTIASSAYEDLMLAEGASVQNRYITLQFIFKDGTYEMHRLAIKQNPVSQHAINYTEAWKGATNTKVRIINFLMLAVGSSGSTSGGAFDGTGIDPSHYGYYNFAKMYAPCDTVYDAYDKALIDSMTENQIQADKVGGYFGSSNYNGDTSKTTVTSPTAFYYLDLSSSTNNGITHTAGSTAWSLKLMVGNMYNSKVKDASNIFVRENGLTNAPAGVTASIDGTLTADNAFANNAATTGYVTISGNSSTEDILNFTYQLGYEQTASNAPTSCYGIINMPIRVYITDKSDVRDVYNQYAAMQLDSRCFSDDSWAAYSEALLACEQYLNNYQTNADPSLLIRALNNGFDGLQKSDDPFDHDLQSVVTPPTCTEGGFTTKTCSRCGYSFVEAALNTEPAGHTNVYTSNNDYKTHTVTCSFNDMDAYTELCSDENKDGTCDNCGQSVKQLAKWEAFNAAKSEMEAALEAALTTDKHTEAGLAAANTAIAAAGFYNYTVAEQAGVFEDSQSAIDSQAAAISAAAAALLADSADSSVYDANIAKGLTLNADAYNLDGIRTAMEGIETTTQVAVNGKEYPAYNFDAYNTAFGTAINENLLPYKIEVQDFNFDSYYLVKNADGSFGYTTAKNRATIFHYGDYVTVTNPNPDNAGEECAWASAALPVSRSIGQTTDRNGNVTYNYNFDNCVMKYQTTAASYSFNVRGETLFYTTATATNDETNHRVSIVISYSAEETAAIQRGEIDSTKILDVQYVVDGDPIPMSYFAVPTNIPFYQLSRITDLNNGTYGLPSDSSAEFTPDKDTYLIAEYHALAPNSYTITLVNESGTKIQEETAPFNTAITFAAPGAVSYINAENGKALCYGSEYSFWACRDITIKALTTSAATADVDVIVTPVVDGNNKVYLVGSFVLPEGATVCGKGFVLDYIEPTRTSLSLSDVSSLPRHKVFNLSASKHTNDGQNGNQFTISFTKSATYQKAAYVAYVMYQLNGETYYAYSDVISNATIY